MRRGGGAVGRYLPSIPVQWWLLIVFVPDEPDFSRAPLGWQIVEVAIPALVAAFLIAYCWQLLRMTSSDASSASTVSLFGVAGLFCLLALGPTLAGRFVWWIPVDAALVLFLGALGIREWTRVRRIRIAQFGNQDLATQS